MKKGIALRVAIVSLLFFFITANAAVWYVHPDSTFNSIQAGLDSCANNDVVLVAPVTYYEILKFQATQLLTLI